MKTDHQSHFPAPAQENRKLRTGYWLRERYFDFLCPAVALILFFSLWEGYVRLSGIQNYILPGPLEILQGLVEHRGKLVSHSLVTAFEMLLGYSCSIIFGSLFAFLVVRSSTLDKALMPLFFFSQTVSKIAIAPLFVIWFGFGILPKVLVSFLISFFPIFISTSAGLKSVETEMLELIHSMSPTTFQVFWKVRIPTALPHFFAGARVAVPFAAVGAIVGEWIASDRGLGYYLLLMQGDFDTAGLFATILTASFTSIALYLLVARLERLFLPWHVSVRGEQQLGLTV
ncbi:MAG: ABC transporter permease [Deltaproteobacteria bacterium]|nr:ABC transporter permease [Deltaproteobacteria bacterium]